mgnify:CR=1 FL=1
MTDFEVVSQNKVIRHISIEAKVTIDGSIFEVMFDLERGHAVNIEIASGDEYVPLSCQSKELRDKIEAALEKEIPIAIEEGTLRK